MNHRTILLTGATSGLGRAVAHQLAQRPDRLILHGRKSARLQELAAELADQPATIDLVEAELDDLAQVRLLGQTVRDLTDRLDVVVHNAGVGKGATDERAESADGYELRLAVNHLAPFALHHHLLPVLGGDTPTRIVLVASGAQQPVDFADPHLTRGYSGNRAYAQSKFAMVATGFVLAQRLPVTTATVNSLHPATLMPTRMVQEGYGRTVDTLETGVEAVLNLVNHPELASVTGQYFSVQEPSRAHPETYDPATQRQLWQLSAELTGLPSDGD